ncbi:general control transcription factor Gcn4p [[Candida] anglica]|uniref:General control transcription factor Gcn4p n=1 Tax=[Candida] anglica TaxID=148631 RepID=A0ABP0EBD4_9ASCO
MSSTDPMIFSADSIMFESTDTLAPTTLAFDLPQGHVKQEPSDELSSHLPGYYGDASSHSQIDSTSPFDIHSAVLDSVFSTSADDAHPQDHTPMFDELDLIVDGAKANSKDDWVSLFGGEEKSLATEDSSLMQTNVSNAPKRLFCEIEETFEFAPMKNVEVSPQEQLNTPIHSANTTPLLDVSKPVSLANNTTFAEKTDKVDHLGCVTYSKKQRTQPLNPVKADVSDPVLLKRARNTEAARRSRARKMERMGQLEVRVEGLLRDKSDLESEVSRLKELLMVNGISF